MRKYGACYYEISKAWEVTDEEVEGLQDANTDSKVSILFQLTHNTHMNVYIYGGKSRFDATK